MVCVTKQKTCQRLIDYGKSLMTSDEDTMHIIHVAGIDYNFLGDSEDGRALEYLYENKRLVNGRLAMIKGADLLLRVYYLSSSEYSNGYVWLLYFGDGDVNGYGKGNYGYVRPVLAF